MTSFLSKALLPIVFTVSLAAAVDEKVSESCMSSSDPETCGSLNLLQTDVKHMKVIEVKDEPKDPLEEGLKELNKAQSEMSAAVDQNIKVISRGQMQSTKDALKAGISKEEKDVQTLDKAIQAELAKPFLGKWYYDWGNAGTAATAGTIADIGDGKIRLTTPGGTALLRFTGQDKFEVSLKTQTAEDRKKGMEPLELRLTAELRDDKAIHWDGTFVQIDRTYGTALRTVVKSGPQVWTRNVNSECTDTPGYKFPRWGGDNVGRTCDQLKPLMDGGYGICCGAGGCGKKDVNKDTYGLAIGEKYNFPENNCCVCGKKDKAVPFYGPWNDGNGHTLATISGVCIKKHKEYLPKDVQSTFAGTCLTTYDGSQAVITFISAKKIKFTFHGKELTGELRDQKIHWSDGSTWEKGKGKGGDQNQGNGGDDDDDDDDDDHD